MRTIFTVVLNMTVSLTVMQLLILAVRVFLAPFLSARTKYRLWYALPISAALALIEMPIIAVDLYDLVAQLWGLVAVAIAGLGLFFLLRKYARLVGSREAGGRIFEICKRDCKAEHVRVKLCRSGAVRVPITWGVFYRKILIPDTVDETDTPLMYHLCCHELIHAKRMDNLRIIAFQTMCCMFWFSPIMWLCLWLFCRDVEQSCDEITLHVGGKITQTEYLRMLRSVSMFPAKQMEKQESSMRVTAFEHRMVLQRIERIRNVKKQKRTSALTAILVLLLCTLGLAASYEARPYLLLYGSHIYSDGYTTENLARMEVFAQRVQKGQSDAIELVVVNQSGKKIRYHLLYQDATLICRTEEPGQRAYYETYTKLVRTQNDGMIYYTLVSDTQKKELLTAQDDGAQKQIQQNLAFFVDKLTACFYQKTGQINTTYLKTMYLGEEQNVVTASAQAAYLYNYDAVQNDKVSVMKMNGVSSETASAWELDMVQQYLEDSLGKIGTYQKSYDEEAAKYMFGDLFELLNVSLKAEYLQSSDISVRSDKHVEKISFILNEQFEKECAYLFKEQASGLTFIYPEGFPRTTITVKFDTKEQISTVTMRRMSGRGDSAKHLMTFIYDLSLVGNEVDLYKEVDLKSFEQANLILEKLTDDQISYLWIQPTINHRQEVVTVTNQQQLNIFNDMIGDLTISVARDGAAVEQQYDMMIGIDDMILYLQKDKRQMTVRMGNTLVTYHTQIIPYQYLQSFLTELSKQRQDS